MGRSGAGLNTKSAKSNPSNSQMAGHPCCKARHHALQKESGPESTLTVPREPSEDVVSCCPFTSGSFVAASRTQLSDNHSELVLQPSHDRTLSLSVQAARAIPTRLANHERTYLTCCVFLI